MFIAHNISFLLRARGIKKIELAKYLDKQPTTIGDYAKGKTLPSVEMLIKIAEYFHVSIDDLVYEKMSDDSGGDHHEPDQPNNFKPDFKHQGPSRNMLVPASAYAGYALEWSQEPPKSAHFIEVPGISGDARTFEVDGDSMEPVLYDGDYVSCKPVKTASDIRSGHLYCIVSRSAGPQIKYVQLTRTSLKMLPANREGYQPYDLEFEDIMEVWEVALRITRNLMDPRIELGTYVNPDRIRRLEKFIGQVHPDFGKG